jgi:hypothetical protein
MAVSVNGARVCSVGLKAESDVGVDLCWIGSERVGGLLLFRIGGIEGDDHLQWAVPQLKIGDELTIKILEDPAPDLPSERKRVEDPESAE